MYDAIVVGGGPAGLQAALTLGRMHRSVLVLDAGPGRNGPTRHMHNFITQDGRSPEDFRAAARADLAAYPHIEVRDAAAARVAAADPGFSVATDDGELRCRRLVLATGVEDELPPIPGLSDLWGSVVLQCPYCDGHEQSGRQVAVICDGSHAARLGLMMARFAERVTVLTNGGSVGAEDTERLRAAGVPVRQQEVTKVFPEAVGARVELAGGVDLVVQSIFVAPGAVQRAPFAEQLGLDLHGDGCVASDLLGRTSLDGVYAAGDMARCGKAPMTESSVLAAAAGGQLAGTLCDLDLLSEDTGLARVP